MRQLFRTEMKRPVNFWEDLALQLSVCIKAQPIAPGLNTSVGY